jgi:hypothetical protein
MSGACAEKLFDWMRFLVGGGSVGKIVGGR